MKNLDKLKLENVTDTIETLATGIPAPIRKNFWKAFSQLCTAAVDVPVANLQGRADQIRAEYKARIDIITKQGRQISENSDVPAEYIKAASEKFAQKIVRERMTVDEIIYQAANNLSQEKFRKTEQADKGINEDWLNSFENIAKEKTSDDMKIIFSKILSNEIKNPGSYSIRALKTISELKPEVALIFQKFCSHCIEIKSYHKVIYAGIYQFREKIWDDNDVDINYSDGLLLSEFGLIDLTGTAIDLKYIRDIKIKSVQENYMKINHENYRVGFKDDKKRGEFTNIPFTSVGLELYDIVPKIDKTEYFEKVLKKMETSENLKLTKINLPDF